MSRKKVKTQKHNTKIAVFFVIFVCLIILGSVILKAVHLVSQGNFDGSNRFTISISSNKNFKILSFSPNTRSISVLKLDGKIKNLNVNKFLGIPIDGFVKAGFLETDRDVASLMSNIVFGYRRIETNLTIVDVLRLFLVSKTTSLNDISTVVVSSTLESARIDEIVAKLFNDSEIEKEDQTIEIVNATSVIGLGARLGRLITNMGGKVVQVSTGNLQRNSLILYNGRETYTLRRLSKLLGFKITQENKQSIANIKIVLGEDSKNPSLF